MNARTEVIVSNDNGVHVRPATQIVETANRFACRIILRRGDEEANAKSVIEVLQMAILQGERIEVIAEGKGADRGVKAIVALFDEKFGFEK
ncbi:MAG: HPr family phosphocarrier protein [Planctomycetes bacterium]|nr:HPr family phosphocarrier protein [Planctomycetota bacterium]